MCFVPVGGMGRYVRGGRDKRGVGSALAYMFSANATSSEDVVLTNEGTWLTAAQQQRRAEEVSPWRRIGMPSAHTAWLSRY